MRQNSFTDACPKLEESQRIDPAVGTLLYLGECYERVGKVASAWATFREAASLATNSNQPDRARVASSRAQDLEPKLSRLSVELAPEVAKLPGVVVKRNGQKIEPALYGTPLPVDPAEYTIEVSAPGYETWSTPIKVEGGGASASVRVPQLMPAKDAPATKPGATDAAKPAPDAAPVGSSDSGGSSTQRTLGLVVAGVGVVGLGVGSFFGVRAISRNSDAENHCPKGTLCQDDAGVSLTNQALKDARTSNIFFVAGGVLAATGVVLFLTGGSSRQEHVALVPVLGPNTAAAGVSGRF
jgi:serine/threonine-protein kinase